MLCAALLVFAITAGVSAAPYLPDYDDFIHHYHHEPLHHPLPPPPPRFNSNYDYMPSQAFGSDMFDAKLFWMDLTREMMSIDRMLTEFQTHYPSSVFKSEYVGNTYKITIPLTGFAENEIKVKANNSILMVQAVHTGEVSKNYVDARTLPKNVDANGTWTYDGSVLVIIFPLKKSTDDTNNAGTDESSKTDTEIEAKPDVEILTSTVGQTEEEGEDKSREQMETNQKQDDMDADVGLKINIKSDEDIETNVIPTEASPSTTITYRVGSNSDDVDFVPIKYK